MDWNSAMSVLAGFKKKSINVDPNLNIELNWY